MIFPWNPYKIQVFHSYKNTVGSCQNPRSSNFGSESQHSSEKSNAHSVESESLSLRSLYYMLRFKSDNPYNNPAKTSLKSLSNSIKSQKIPIQSLESPMKSQQDPYKIPIKSLKLHQVSQSSPRQKLKRRRRQPRSWEKGEKIRGFNMFQTGTRVIYLWKNGDLPIKNGDLRWY